MGTVMITAEEYRELIIKAHKYDQLREKAVNSSFVSDCEAIIYDLTEEEAEAIAYRGRSRSY